MLLLEFGIINFIHLLFKGIHLQFVYSELIDFAILAVC